MTHLIISDTGMAILFFNTFYFFVEMRKTSNEEFSSLNNVVISIIYVIWFLNISEAILVPISYILY